MKHVLVTGGNGFIGGYVVEELVRRGYAPSIFDRHWVEATEHPRYFGDVKDATLVDDAVGHSDAVIHLSGILGTQETVADPRPSAETNIMGGLNVVMAAAKYDVPLVNIAVGNYWEDNTYSITKNAIERIVLMKQKYEHARMASVRALNAYGPRQVAAAPYGPSRVRKIMPSFVCRALTGEPIEIYGDGNQIMDMIYVTDVARVLVSTLQFVADGNVPRETIEAGTGRATTVNEIAMIVRDEVASQTRGGKIAINRLPMRPGESDHAVVLGHPSSLVDINMDAMDFVRLEDGVSATVEYFKGYLKGAK